ncbi:alpha/beta hydrolase [Streptomyces sp. A7024]|uniref:Alpha/beta hydrolase n=1 Tax=Streptomyces coryli TaxID=1128680 RepID=A0A6G4TV53_9ACTN|nr:alpha/beta hydrolase [Streptomyces coryli]NGN62871.1 alpha/beta hydrolase [Streptomyces coryli]
MPIFTSYDGTQLAYHEEGEGPPLVCLPGGAMRASEYLGDLGGLTAHRTLLRLDLRGTGESAVPADAGTYRVDRQVADVEALRAHLGLDAVDLLAHSAGAVLATRYAFAHPERIRRLVLVTPGMWNLGLGDDLGMRREALELRTDEPWYPEAKAALDALAAGEAPGPEIMDAVRPLTYGRWDAAAQAHAAGRTRQFNFEAAAAFAGADDPDASRAAAARLAAPVLVLAGELDGYPRPRTAREAAALFPAGEAAALPGAAHYPWLDAPTRFTAVVEGFLAG